MEEQVLGLISGGGNLPILVAQGMKAAGASVCGVGLRDHYDSRLPDLCDEFEVAGIFRIGHWIKAFRRWGVQQAVLVGRVSKARMHQPLRLFRQMPDWRAAKVWYRRLGDDRRSATVLVALADELRESGITLIDTTSFINDHLAGHGGAKAAVRAVAENLASHTFVFRTDVKSYYASIDHDLLYDRLRTYISDPPSP